MTHRDRVLACLHYEEYDRLPLIHFGFWPETLAKWCREGHIPEPWAANWADGNAADRDITRALGFDGNWVTQAHPLTNLLPAFEPEVLNVLPDGSRRERNANGVVVLVNDDAVSIPMELDHLLVDRASWERHYLPRLQYTEARVAAASTPPAASASHARPDAPVGLFCGSLFGVVRNWLGLTGVSYLYADDEALYDEIIDTVADLAWRCTRDLLATGMRIDFGHFWEDICFRSGPLVVPRVFAAKVGPHYRRITGLLRSHDIDLVSLDCDGCIDSLVPIWLQNGVNVMFPIEVGTWHGSIAPWRRQYGRDLRGVGGMNKHVLAADRAAVDAEVERLKPLVNLGGYIPCPDHRLAPDAEWDNVRYYCDRMHAVFAG